MPHIVLALAGALTLGLVTTPAHSQLRLGGHAAYIAGGFGSLSDLEQEIEDRDLSGTLGIGARLVLTSPGLPFNAFGSATYYLPDCSSADCSYWTGELGATFDIPIPLAQPYLIAGWQWKTYDIDIENFDGDMENNPFAGVGIGLGSRLFVEGVFEFEGDLDNLPGSTEEFSVTPFVIKGGLYFGG